MNYPKDRKLNDYLKANIKKQERRIKECGLEAFLNYYHPLQVETGSFYSTRFKS